MTRPFTCRAIARPFDRLAIACFYVYSLIYFDTDLELISIVQCSFTWPQQREVEAIQLELPCNEPASNALNSTITQQQVCGAIRCMDTAVWKLHDSFLHAASVYVFPSPMPVYQFSFWPLVWKNSITTFLAYNAQFQFLSFSKVCYSFLHNLQFVYSSGNGKIHDYVTRCNKTQRNWEIETGQWNPPEAKLLLSVV